MTVESFLDDIRTASTRTSYVTGVCSFIHFIYSLPPIKGERSIMIKGHVVTKLKNTLWAVDRAAVGFFFFSFGFKF